jgi:ribulose-phosphate 3-epimerase
MPGLIAPSLMCIDFTDLRGGIRQLEAAGVEYLHFDIMDGSFVPNFTLGPDFVKAVRGLTSIPFDIHLMVQQPEKHIEIFEPREKDLVVVHVESTVHLHRTLQKIRATGATPGAALNPATPIDTLDYVLDEVGMVLVMTVNPGFAGQKLVPSTLQKIADMRKYLDARGHKDILIEVDGNVSFENAKKMRAMGADIFVAGTSSLFIKGRDLADTAAELRRNIL